MMKMRRSLMATKRKAATKRRSTAKKAAPKRKAAPKSVITSYSIHYTKLYDILNSLSENMTSIMSQKSVKEFLEVLST